MTEVLGCILHTWYPQIMLIDLTFVRSTQQLLELFDVQISMLMMMTMMMILCWRLSSGIRVMQD